MQEEELDPCVSRLTTATECEDLADNLEQKYPELAFQARRRAVVFRAIESGAKSDMERDVYEVLHAYESALHKKHGKRVKASRTRKLIKDHGPVGAVIKAVDRQDETVGFEELKKLGLQDYSFEAVVVRHPGEFAKDVLERCEQRLATWTQAAT